MEKGKQCGQRLESKVSHFTLKDHTDNNTWTVEVNLEGEKKSANAKPIGCVYRKYDISHEELSCKLGEKTMYEFIKELTNIKCKNLQSNK